MSVLNITGDFVTVGELAQEDAVPLLGVPSLQLRLDDGRIVTLTGLTREECRAAAALFLERATISVARPGRS